MAWLMPWEGSEEEKKLKRRERRRRRRRADLDKAGHEVGGLEPLLELALGKADEELHEGGDAVLVRGDGGPVAGKDEDEGKDKDEDEGTSRGQRWNQQRAAQIGRGRWPSCWGRRRCGGG